MNFGDFYYNLPNLIDPVAFTIGSFAIRWYSISYLMGFFTVIVLVRYRIKKCENNTGLSWDDIFDFLTYSFLGAVIGGRIGYVLFYNLDYFLHNPLDILYPVSSAGYFSGFYGMSFHGGVLGFIVVWLAYSTYKKADKWKLIDFIVPTIPAGYFFGRLGNFLNGELYGRETNSFLGMNFGDAVLRHPSQLYEAFFEGLILFVILWSLRNKLKKRKGLISILFLGGYSFFRFFVEFFREPDSQLGFVWGFLTTGQILSASILLLVMLVVLNGKINNRSY